LWKCTIVKVYDQLAVVSKRIGLVVSYVCMSKSYFRFSFNKPINKFSRKHYILNFPDHYDENYQRNLQKIIHDIRQSDAESTVELIDIFQIDMERVNEISVELFLDEPFGLG